jgi:hypothetical protein
VKKRGETKAIKHQIEKGNKTLSKKIKIGEKILNKNAIKRRN